ncbi:MAG: hypothetical protein [Bacteriophage sp.]|nr:MAG: hypothetical protein [Bacteriophage sp.]
MSDNVQTLPAGLQGRVAQATTAPAPQPAPLVAPIDQGPVTQPAPAAAPQVPAADAPVNPMLSHVSQPQVPAVAPVDLTKEPPQVPTLEPVKVPGSEPVAQSATVSDMAGELAKDPNLAPAVNYLDAFCAEHKVDMARAFGNAAEEGDARFIDRAYLRDVLGDKADAVIKTAEGVLNYTNAYAEQTVNAVITLAGGQAQWDAAGNAFNQHAPADERKLISEMLDSGLREKVTYAAKRIMEYATQAGAISTHNAPAIGQPGTQQGLSKADYVKAISERNISPEKYEQLKTLRKLGLSQGL